MRSGGALVHGRLCHLTAGGPLEQEALSHVLCRGEVGGEASNKHFASRALSYMNLGVERGASSHVSPAIFVNFLFPESISGIEVQRQRPNSAKTNEYNGM